eukprot:361746-Chlamydomonas_euryale.AAC.2
MHWTIRQKGESQRQRVARKRWSHKRESQKGERERVRRERERVRRERASQKGERVSEERESQGRETESEGRESICVASASKGSSNHRHPVFARVVLAAPAVPIPALVPAAPPQRNVFTPSHTPHTSRSLLSIPPWEAGARANSRCWWSAPTRRRLQLYIPFPHIPFPHLPFLP